MVGLFKDKVSYLFKWEILALVVLDCILLPLALFSAILLRLGGDWDPRITPHIWLLLCIPLWTIPLFINFGLYRAIVRYLDDKVVFIVFKGVTVSVLILTLLIRYSSSAAFPRTAIIIYWVFALAYIGGSRFTLRGLLRKIGQKENVKLVAIYGAGSAGVQLESSLKNGNEYLPVFFIDDDDTKWRSTIHGLKVFSPDELSKVSKAYNINEVLLAIPSTSLNRRKEVLNQIESCGLYVKTLPGISEIIKGEVKFTDIKEVEIEDLLGRIPVPSNPDLLTKNIVDRVVLVTGAGGSIGSELTRQISSIKPRKLIILDSSEFAVYKIEQEIREQVLP